MARSIDQVPQYQDNSPEEPSASNAPLGQSPAHEPRLHPGTSLKDAYEKSFLKGMDPEDESLDLNIPDHIPQNVVENPRAGGAIELPEKKKNPWVKRGVVAVAGAVAVSLGAGIVHYKNTKDAIEKSPLNIGGGDRSTSAPVVPGQEGARDYSNVDPNTLSQVEFFSSYPEELRIKWATEYVNEHFNESLQSLNKHLSDYNRTLLPENVPDHLSEDSDINDILNYQAVVNWMAAKLPQNDKERVLSAIVDTESTDRQDIMNNVKADSSATWEVTVGDVTGDTAGEKRLISPRFKETSVQGYSPNGSPSYIAVITNIHLQSASEVTLRYTHNQWVLSSVLSPETDMDRWITDPASLQVR